jgi:hypothetical protein
MLRTVMFFVGILGPFAIWAGVFVAAQQSLFTPDSMLSALRAWRWIAWVAALSLGLLFFAPLHLHWVYAGCASSFSLGLSFPEFWLKSRLCATNPPATSLR